MIKRFIYKYGFFLAITYWFFARPKSRGAICIIRNGMEVLFVRHTYGFRGWGFPGGGIKRGETPENTVVREIKEELGVELNNIKKAGIFIFTNYFRNDEVHLYEANISGSEVKIDNDEIAEARWFNINERPEPLLDIAKQALKLVG